MTARELTRPAFALHVNGTAVPVGVAVHVSQIRVDDDVSLPGMFAIELAAGKPDAETAWLDGALFDIGGAVEIKLGYGDKLQQAIVGEITGLEPAFIRGAQPRLTVRGFDRRHRLLRGRKTRSFIQQKDSDIAASVASDAGLSATTVDSGVVHDYVLQADQTDMAFLRERARRIQYEVVVEDKTLHFRPVQNDQGELFTLSPDDDLLEFHSRLSTLGQSSDVEVRGWNPKTKEAWVATASAGAQTTSMGGTDTGAALTQRAFGKASDLIGTTPVLTLAEADQLARSRYNQALLQLISGDAICIGRADLRPGTVVKLDGLGTRFSGRYYVQSTTHTYTPHAAYQTHLVLRRNAS